MASRSISRIVRWWTLFFAILAVGCGGGPGMSPGDDDVYGDDDNAPTAEPTPASTEPFIRIISPEPGEVDPTFFVSVQIDNFVLEPVATSGQLMDDHGHWHLSIDGKYYDLCDTTDLEVRNLPPGEHSLQAELVHGDHSSLSPPVFSDEVMVSVPAPPQPTIDITAPESGSTQEGSFTLTVAVQNFVLSTEVDDALKGDGQYLVYVNSVYDGAGRTETYHVENLKDGVYEVKVVLAGNDFEPLEPEIADAITVTVVNTRPPEPDITIVYPAEDAQILSSSTELRVEVAEFALDADAVGSDTNVENSGHYRVSVDGLYQRDAASLTSVVTDLEPGLHDITVELVNNDHSSLEPPKSDSVLIRVVAGAPQLSILSPAQGASIDAGCTWVELGLTNFTLEAAGTSANAPGIGHYRIALDGVYYDYGASSTVVVADLTPGEHEIRFELVNNDGSPLEFPVVDDVRIAVPEEASGIQVVAPPGQDVQLELGQVAIELEVFGFEIDADAAGGTENADGRGHYQLLVDDVLYAYGTELKTKVDGLGSGTHTIVVELVNNDHSPLEPRSLDYVRVKVP